MPASRSRTSNWLRSLRQIYERGGCLEITLARYVEGDEQNLGALAGGQGPTDIIWRVRILQLNEHDIVLEQPVVLGQTIELHEGVELAGIISVGQNRWMFRTELTEKVRIGLSERREVTALRIGMPDRVERCQRREFYRVGTVGLHLPNVRCFPMDDPTTALTAEVANRQEFLRRVDSQIAGAIGKDDPDEMALPEVGPPYDAHLVNIGGGGVGLVIRQEDHPALEASRFLWLRIDLRPDLPAPLCVCARPRHTHIDSMQNVYAGLSFEFGTRHDHREFVVDQICKYVAHVQREQLRRARHQA